MEQARESEELRDESVARPKVVPEGLTRAQENAYKYGGAIQKTSYTHEGMIDLIIANPMISQGEIARHFGFTQGWVSQIFSSDAFREMLTKRKKELVDPLITQGVENRLEALCMQSINVLQQKLESNPSADVALKTLEVTARAKGYGVQKGPTINVGNFVVEMPRKEGTAREWVQEHSPLIEREV